MFEIHHIQLHLKTSANPSKQFMLCETLLEYAKHFLNAS